MDMERQAAGASSNNAMKKAASQSAMLWTALAVLCVAVVALAVALVNVNNNNAPAMATRSELGLGWKPKHNPAEAVSDLLAKALAAQDILPKKYSTPYVPPMKLQLARGTCYIFSTLAVVEHMYRQQGIAKGYLKPDEYVRFSEQAYGRLLIEYCLRDPSACMFAGDGIAAGTTEGGEMNVLYTFKDDFSTTLLPASVCPYVGIEGKNELDCPGIDKALEKNPIKAEMDAMTPVYDITAIKKALLDKKTSLALGYAVTGSNLYQPCDDPKADWDVKACMEECVRCPLTYGSKCCKAFLREQNNMMGELSDRNDIILWSGHGVMLVGYNDEYTTEDGFKGGFIFRNSWKEGVYSWNTLQYDASTYNTRGSHSIPYFMQTISDADERLLCPNLRYPRNWAYAANFSFDPSSPKYGPYDVQSAKDQLMVLFLQCNPNSTDSNVCKKDKVYALQDYQAYGDGLYVFKMTELPAQPNGSLPINVIGKTVELPPRTMEQIAQNFLPLGDMRHNLLDTCGFYFLPYAHLDKLNAMFRSNYIIQYDIQFSESSYAANKAKYPQYNYTLIEQSTYTQTEIPAALYSDVFANGLPGHPDFDYLPQDPADHTDLLRKRARLQSAGSAKPRKFHIPSLHKSRKPVF